MGCRKTLLKARKLVKVSNGNSFTRSTTTIGAVEYRYEGSEHRENENYHESRDEMLLPAPLRRGFLIFVVSFVHGLSAPITILA